jgi:hypothetical protein
MATPTMADFRTAKLTGKASTRGIMEKSTMESGTKA